VTTSPTSSLFNWKRKRETICIISELAQTLFVGDGPMGELVGTNEGGRYPAVIRWE